MNSSTATAVGTSMRAEVIRKLIHLSSAVVPLAVWFLPRGAAIAALSVVLAVAVAVEWSRTRVRWVRYHFLVRTRRILRRSERHRTAGATHMAVGYLLAVLLFPRVIAVTAMLYNAIGDAVAALVGRRWGRRRTTWGKSWEGAAAGFAANVAVGLALPGVSLPIAMFGAAVAAILEFLPLPIDDNIAIPLGGGAALWIATGLMA